MIKYKEYIESLPKQELIDLIVGTEEIAPLLTRNEPTYSRPQITWGINKLNKERKVGLEYTQDDVLKILSNIERLRYDKFFNYDYFTFEIRKPSFWVFTVMFLCSIIGAAQIILWIADIVMLIYGFIKII